MSHTGTASPVEQLILDGVCERSRRWRLFTRRWPAAAVALVGIALRCCRARLPFMRLDADDEDAVTDTLTTESQIVSQATADSTVSVIVPGSGRLFGFDWQSLIAQLVIAVVAEIIRRWRDGDLTDDLELAAVADGEVPLTAPPENVPEPSSEEPETLADPSDQPETQ